MELNNAGITNANNTTGWWNPVPGSLTHASSNATSIADIYPFASATSVSAATCQAEATAFSTTVTSSSVSTQPGAPAPPAANSTTTTVPLGMLALRVTKTSGGVADPGATIVLTSTTTNCANNQYILQTPGPDGLSRTEVPFGSYSMTVTNTAGLVTTYPSVTLGVGSATISGTTTALPSSAPVVG